MEPPLLPAINASMDHHLVLVGGPNDDLRSAAEELMEDEKTELARQAAKGKEWGTGTTIQLSSSATEL